MAEMVAILAGANEVNPRGLYVEGTGPPATMVGYTVVGEAVAYPCRASSLSFGLSTPLRRHPGNDPGRAR
jgi:hypothetical protein